MSPQRSWPQIQVPHFLILLQVAHFESGSQWVHADAHVLKRHDETQIMLQPYSHHGLVMLPYNDGLQS